MSVCFRKAGAHRNVDASGGIELQFYSYKGTQLLEKAEHVEEAISYHPAALHLFQYWVNTLAQIASKESHWTYFAIQTSMPPTYANCSWAFLNLFPCGHDTHWAAFQGEESLIKQIHWSRTESKEIAHLLGKFRNCTFVKLQRMGKVPPGNMKTFWNSSIKFEIYCQAVSWTASALLAKC